MSSEQNTAATQAYGTNKFLAQQYYDIALPGLESRLGSINKSLGAGEPGYLKQAYEQQRTGLTEGLAARGGAAQAQQMAGAGQALSGGNQFASMHPADVGAQLANALYGSKFTEGQANLGQQFNLMSMGMGGAGTAGNAALDVSGNQLKAIGYMPNYNQGYANVVGGAAGLASIYGAGREAGWWGNAFPNMNANPWGSGSIVVPGSTGTSVPPGFTVS